MIHYITLQSLLNSDLVFSAPFSCFAAHKIYYASNKPRQPRVVAKATDLCLSCLLLA